MALPKLALYSEQALPASAGMDSRALALIGRPRPRIGFVPAQADLLDRYFRDRRAYYARYGADLAVRANLDHGYDPAAVDALFDCDAIHLSGGNTFHFLLWLRRRDMLQRLRAYAAAGGVLIGTSAGAILLTPEITTAGLVGDPREPGLAEDGALGLVDFAFVPHWGATEAAPADFESYARHSGLTLYACGDDAGLIVDGDHLEPVGPVRVLKNDRWQPAHAWG